VIVTARVGRMVNSNQMPLVLNIRAGVSCRQHSSLQGILRSFSVCHFWTFAIASCSRSLSVGGEPNDVSISPWWSLHADAQGPSWATSKSPAGTG
jgi:hypothetical protein